MGCDEQRSTVTSVPLEEESSSGVSERAQSRDRRWGSCKTLDKSQQAEEQKEMDLRNTWTARALLLANCKREDRELTAKWTFTAQADLKIADAKF